ncbi:MAG: thiamine pyrophosphate-dependent dehydrogenase E1 component subunit alpha [Meiothermus sp.]|nr:thiamine pyrophosphate-dependent dehydrogenase E1 component subunit alpha [Meiothermus sp.]
MSEIIPEARRLELLRTMLRIRAFEEKVGELFLKGGTAGSMLHLSIGEEGAAAGVALAMKPGDTFTTHHRGHGIFVARGGDVNRMMAEIAGKITGYCRGKGGSMHIADMSLGHLGANAIVGGGIPAVVGAGLSSKTLSQGSVSVAFFGDGAMQQGICFESMNLAALWKLPVVFAVINNQYGMGTRIDRASATLDFAGRARGFGLTALEVDATQPEQVLAAAQELIEHARAGRGAGFIVANCYRFYGHARKDKSPYRDEAEELEGRKRDPILNHKDALVAAGLLSEAGFEEMNGAANLEMDEAVAFAQTSELPGLETMFEDVFDPSIPRPVSVDERLDRVLGGGA